MDEEKARKRETYELRGGPRTTKRELQAFMLEGKT
jgi:hypothetical protein